MTEAQTMQATAKEVSGLVERHGLATAIVIALLVVSIAAFFGYYIPYRKEQDKKQNEREDRRLAREEKNTEKMQEIIKTMAEVSAASKISLDRSSDAIEQNSEIIKDTITMHEQMDKKLDRNREEFKRHADNVEKTTDGIKEYFDLKVDLITSDLSDIKKIADKSTADNAYMQESVVKLAESIQELKSVICGRKEAV